MKRLTLTLVVVLCYFLANAAYFKNLEHKYTQPDGSVVECFMSGDEFFNWVHDSEGYTLVKGKDGYLYYAIKLDGEIVPSEYKVNSVNPDEVGLTKWIKISKANYLKKKQFFKDPSKSGPSMAPHTGTLNNLVIYIKFSGESEIATTRETYDNKLNPETGESLKAYYNEVSYNQLTINSTHYPACAEPTTTNASYEDSHARDYFRPYDATTNTIGYQDEIARREREHQLLVDAINWINTNEPIDAGLNIDADGDGNVDNVCFMIKGDSDGWNDLLWAHRWVLWTQNVYINSKRVYDYTFQPENQVSVRTLCHEMFHALGAPDLYHYEEAGAGLDPVGRWDIMEQGGGHMGAYMKWKYADGKWISDIPEITSTGTYTLNRLTSSTNNCYKIASPFSTEEYFVLEYRKKGGDFESNLPGNGLLVYRINSNFEGNAEYDGVSIFDEVYIYRPGGTTTTNGYINNAFFNSSVERTEINDGTDPASFLVDGTDGGLLISEVGTADETISFKVTFKDFDNPGSFSAIASSETQIDLNWNLNADNNSVILIYSEDGVFGSLEDGLVYNNGDNITGGGTVLYKGNSTSYNHTSLIHSKYYHYKIYSINVNNEYSYGESKSVATLCGEIGFPIIEDFSDGFVPPCWENVDNDGSGQVWEFYEVGNFASSTAENGSAILDSDAYGSTGTQDADLITPIYDFSSYSEIYLSFIHTFKKYSSSLATLSYSVNGGTSWTVIDTWNTNTGTKEDPVAYFNDLSDKVAGYSEVVFKWNYVGAFEYHWIIDDIVITNDITKPDVVISSDESTETTVHPIPLTITFNEPVAGFELEDLSLTNATASNLNSISDSLYIVDIEPNQAGNIVVNISSGVAYDASGNINNAASEWSISFSYPVGINNFNETEFSVYPNPTNGILNLDIKNDYKTALIKVVDLTGKLIFIKEIEKTQNKINLSGLDKGMYILNIQIDNEVYNSQILIN